MPSLIDLTGQRFGRWTVIEKAESKNRAVYWKCICDCGTVKDVKAASLRNGDSKSCGCYHKEKVAQILSKTGKNNLKNILGQTFGDLTVIRPSDKRSPNGHAYWWCKCSCGNEIEVLSNRLINNNITHCGCKTILSKGEEKIKALLTINKITFEQQKIFDTCRYPSHHPARFDFWVDNKYLIEFDGKFHTIADSGWATAEKVELTKQHDEIKNQWAKDNNIILIRIPWYHYNNLIIEDLLPETSQFIIS